jgi:Ala-tRNA(Pro) deacylase
MAHHPVTQKILDLLNQGSCWHETFEHEEVRTSEEAAKTRPGYSLRQGAKALIVRTKMAGGERKFVMVVIPADRRFSNDKVKKVIGARDIRFATEEEVADLTDGIKPGAVPPFGNMFGLDVITDASLYDNDKIVFNAGERGFSVAMKSADYRRLVGPNVDQIV